MGASTANRYDIRQVAQARPSVPVAGSTKIYAGIAVAINASGYLVPVTDAVGLQFWGISEQYVDNSGSVTDGALSCSVSGVSGGNLGIIEINAVSPTQAWVGQEVAFTDDHTVALLASTTHVVRCGRVVSVSATGTSGKVLVDTTFTPAAVIPGS